MPWAEETLKLLWGTTEPAKRGPKPSMSVRQIVDSAIGIADAEGLGALSMHRLAKELGVTAMSLYRYIPSKDVLLELLFDAIVDKEPSLTGGGWRAMLIEWSMVQRDLYRQRPWVLELPIPGPPMGPNNMLWLNAALEALVDTGLDEAEKLYVVLTLTVYVRGESLLGLSIRQAEQKTGVSEAERDQVFGQLMHTLATDGRFPAIGRMAQSGIFDDMSDGDPDDDFKFGLERILDGVEAYISRQIKPGSSSSDQEP